MKPEHEYRIYVQDTDGSERLYATLFAKSEGHAKQRAQQAGIKNIMSVAETNKTTETVRLVY